MSKKSDDNESRITRIEDDLRRLKKYVETADMLKVEHPRSALGEARTAAEAICKQIYRSEGCEKGGEARG